MWSSLSALSGAVSNTVVPMIFQYIEKSEPALESMIVSKLVQIKTTNPVEFNTFITNWRKINIAIEKASSTTGGYLMLVPSPLSGGAVEETGPTGPQLSAETGPDLEPEPLVEEPLVQEPSATVGGDISTDATPSTDLGPSGPSGPSGILEPSGPTGPTESIIEKVTNFFSPSGPSGPDTAGKRKHKRKTAKNNKKRTHRVRHKKALNISK
jgi:hypothetical protein